MKVYSLIGSMDYEGSDLLGVFASLDDLVKYQKSMDSGNRYDSYGYVVSNIGQGVSWEDVIEL